MRGTKTKGAGQVDSHRGYRPRSHRALLHVRVHSRSTRCSRRQGATSRLSLRRHTARSRRLRGPSGWVKTTGRASASLRMSSACAAKSDAGRARKGWGTSSAMPSVGAYLQFRELDGVVQWPALQRGRGLRTMPQAMLDVGERQCRCAVGSPRSPVAVQKHVVVRRRSRQRVARRTQSPDELLRAGVRAAAPGWRRGSARAGGPRCLR